MKFELDTASRCHLFRHASEITRETKGGYLTGALTVPASLPKSNPLYVRLSLVPATIDFQNNPYHLHPHLLHINQRTTNKKLRVVADGELPDEVDWALLLKVQNDVVFRVCDNSTKKRFLKRMPSLKRDSKSAETWKDIMGKRLRQSHNGERPLDIGQLNFPTDYYLTKVASVEGANRAIRLGPGGFMLNVITPLQKFSRGGVTISDSLAQRYSDLFGPEAISAASLMQVEDLYTKKKEDRMKLQQVCLLAEVFIVGPDGSKLHFITSALSDVITNSKSREVGPFQLHDINPSVVCANSKTKIFVLSFFKLVADVKANFFLYDPSKRTVVYDDPHDLLAKINHPEKTTVFNHTAMVFTAPQQDERVLDRISELGLQLRLGGFRPSDKMMSTNSFEFTYLKHKPNGCSFCQFFGSDDREPDGSLNLPSARPGVSRRVAEPMDAPDEVLRVNNSCPRARSPSLRELRLPKKRHYIAVDEGIEIKREYFGQRNEPDLLIEAKTTLCS